MFFQNFEKFEKMCQSLAKDCICHSECINPSVLFLPNNGHFGQFSDKLSKMTVVQNDRYFGPK